jgi:uncharacterized protein
MSIQFEKITEEGINFSLSKKFNVEETEYFVEKFSGRIYRAGEGFYLDANIEVSIKDVCDRCLEEFVEKFSSKLNIEIVQNIQIGTEELKLNEDDVGFYIIDEDVVDIEHIAMQESILLRPDKRVCSEKCLGICPGCGANLNFEKCNCQPGVDDRWAALSELMQKSKISDKKGD